MNSNSLDLRVANFVERFRKLVYLFVYRLGEVACKDFYEISNQSEASIMFVNQSKYIIPCVLVSALGLSNQKDKQILHILKFETL